jgi:hypothetical protein
MPPTDLPAPDVVSCRFDGGFAPALAVLCLEWPTLAVRPWRLPGGWAATAPPPTRFGVRVLRARPDDYSVCVVWDEFALRIASTTARELRDSSLSGLLAALGSDLEYILAQPVEEGESPRLAG